MTRIYTYRNGEMAYFENNEKHVISSEEYNALYKDGDASLLYSYLEKEYCDVNGVSKYRVIPFSRIIDAYHKKLCTSKWIVRSAQCYTFEMVRKQGTKDLDVELVYKNDELIAVRVYGFYDRRFEYLEMSSTDSEWIEFLKEWEIE